MHVDAMEDTMAPLNNVKKRNFESCEEKECDV